MVGGRRPAGPSPKTAWGRGGSWGLRPVVRGRGPVERLQRAGVGVGLADQRQQFGNALPAVGRCLAAQPEGGL